MKALNMQLSLKEIETLNCSSTSLLLLKDMNLWLIIAVIHTT